MQMKTIAYHQLTDAQQVPEQWSPTNLPSSFVAEYDDIIW